MTNGVNHCLQCYGAGDPRLRRHHEPDGHAPGAERVPAQDGLGSGDPRRVAGAVSQVLPGRVHGTGHPGAGRRLLPLLAHSKGHRCPPHPAPHRKAHPGHRRWYAGFLFFSFNHERYVELKIFFFKVDDCFLWCLSNES